MLQRHQGHFLNFYLFNLGPFQERGKFFSLNTCLIVWFTTYKQHNAIYRPHHKLGANYIGCIKFVFK